MPGQKYADQNKRYKNDNSNLDMSEMNVTAGNKTISSNTMQKTKLGTTLGLNDTDSELNFALGNLKQKA